jgi:type VII secretion protein EccB
MATKKDLVEAYSFSRRRLVTAFVSGAPGGREVEPARPGRTIVGGLALAVLLVAGAAIAGVFAPRTPDDWNKEGLIISKETGAAYVILEQSDDPELRPVINSTSAKLILGADADPTLISQDTIDDQQIGDDIGILGAPASLPTSSLLIDSGWTACTSDGGGIKVRIAAEPDVTPAPGAGVLVTSGGHDYVIARSARTGDEEPGAYAYPVPPQEAGPKVDQTDNLLAALHLPPSGSALKVSQEWLNTFPLGGPLDWSSFDLDGYGEQPAPPLPGRFKIGELLVTPDGESELVTSSGPVVLDDFAAAVYRNIITPDNRLPTVTKVSAMPSVEHGRELLTGAHWPDSLLTNLPGDPCVQLTAEHGEEPMVQLVSPGEDSSAAGLRKGVKDPSVDPGRGAYVLSGDWADRDQGSPFVIDSKGRANPLVGEGTAALLGYEDHPVVVVPDTWVKLFDCGVNLSQDAALSPPSRRSEAGCAQPRVEGGGGGPR